MDSKYKRLLVRALTCLSETSGLYLWLLTLNNLRPERGFSNPYKGICFGEEIAIKIFRFFCPSDVNSLNSWSSEYRNCLREFTTWRQLSHPNVLPFYGVYFMKGTRETRFCLVSPWMENGNVVEFLARRNRMHPYSDTTNCVCLVRDFLKSGTAFVVMVILSRRSMSHLVFNIFMARISYTGI